MAKIQKHVIRPHSPYRTGVIIGILCLLLAGLAWYSWQQHLALQGSISSNNEIRESAASQQQEVDVLASKMENNLSQLEAAQLAAMIAQQNFAIQHAENEVLLSQLTDLNTDLFAVEKKLSFYETITAKSSGLKAHSFTLTPPQNGTDHYPYQLVITQGLRVSKPVSGRVMFTAVIDGKNTELTDIPFSVNHVQALKGQLTLDPAALPSAIKVTLIVEKGQKTSHTFKWKSLLPPPNPNPE